MSSTTMESRSTPACAARVDVACKCCGTRALPTGSIDFNRTCEDRKAPVFPPAGRPIPYHRCPACSFIFTVAFDHLGPDEWQREIYNDSYVLADPDFVDVRPLANAEHIAHNFGRHPGITLLDYGGGNGLMTRRLVEKGMAQATSYDPFYAGSRRPAGTFDLITSFEVLEHSPTPYDTLKDMREFMGDTGMLYFTTLLQPADIDLQGLTWWYASPRNGHVSLYSRASLDALMKRLGLVWGSCNDLLHVAFRKRPPAFATHLFG